MAQSTSQSIANASAIFGAFGSAASVAERMATALSTGSDISSILRSINIPAAGEAVGDIFSAAAMFSEQADPDDWRARLSIPYWVSFLNSPVFTPLKNAGGLIFPYTPSITVTSTASYKDYGLTHTNYPVRGYQKSEPGQINITAPMYVEDAEQALYWIASLHFLRSLTKMFSGLDMKAGNPPPIVFFNAYGNFVFKNIPVVVSQFNLKLDAETDYIGVEVIGNASSVSAVEIGNIGSAVDSIGTGVAGLPIIGKILSGSSLFSTVLDSVNAAFGSAEQIAAILGAFNVGGTVSGGKAYVPIKSEFEIILQPVYSKQSLRKFSLDLFTTGGYINNYYGYM